jgi:uncharacterized delta-60 repeat protein
VEGGRQEARRARTSITAVAVLSLSLVAALLAPTLAQASDGDLDRSFSGGEVTTQFPFREVTAHSVAIDSQDRIVVAGGAINPSNDDDFVLARYNPNGTLDDSFGGDGKVTTDFGHAETALGVAIDSQDRVVAVGESWNERSSDRTDAVVARYDTDGSLDDSFGGNGKVRTTLGSQNGATAVAIDSQDRVVAVGWGWPGSAEHFAIVRYDTDGSLDPSFGSGGVVTAFFGLSSVWDSSAQAVAIDSHGRIVASGERQDSLGRQEYDFTLARFDTNGGVDDSFSGNGKLVRDSGSGHALAVDSQDRIITTGIAADESALFRYMNGSLDDTFGAAGKAPTGGVSPFSLVIDSRARIVALGVGGGGFALARYRSDGLPDRFFSGDGRAITDFALGDPTDSVAIDSQDRIVAVGALHINNGDFGGFAVARYVGYAPLSVTLSGPSRVATRHRRARARFWFKADKPSTFECAVGSSEPQSCSSPYRTPRVGIGGHRIRVRATDGAENHTSEIRRFQVVRRHR